MSYLKAYFADWNWWDFSWTVIASVTAVWLGLHWGEGGFNTLLSIVTCLTGLWCVILVAKGRILNYYFGIINVLGYAWISYKYQLYGEVMLNALYFFPMQFYGIYQWSKHRTLDAPDSVRVEFLSNWGRFIWALISIAAVGIYGMILANMGDPVPFLDSTSTILSIIATILMTFRFAEQWVLWILVDIVSVAMWYITLVTNGNADIAMLVMWTAYLINAVYGFIMWIQMYKTQRIMEIVRKAHLACMK